MATPPQPPQPTLVKGPCQVCGKEMVYIVPVPRIFNDIDVSVVAFAHPPSKCQQCTAIHVPLVAGTNTEGGIDFVWKLAKASRSPMIVGGNDSTLKQAIEQAQFTEKLRSEGN